MLAWALWDTGAAGVSAIVVTFVFSVYLTGTVGKGLPGGVTPASWLGRALAIAGLTIAVLAPVIGVWVEDPRRRRIALTVLTGMVVALVSAMSLIRDRPGVPVAGAGAARLPPRRAAIWPAFRTTRCCASSRRRRTPAGSPGFGLAAAFVGSVGLLLIVYFGCIAGKGATRGFLQLPAGDGMNVRMAMLLAAGWFVVFALPLLLTAHRLPSPAEALSPARRRAGRLPQALVGPGRRVAPGPQPGVLTWSPARFSATAWQACSRSAACSASTRTGSRRPMC